ncbi:MAG: hypothetical protein ACTHLE_20565 [Agriterribacter sp.]
MIQVRVLVFVMALMVCVQSFGQFRSIDTAVFKLTPAKKNTVINGMTLGVDVRPWSAEADSLLMKVNGLNIELGPFGLIGGIWGTMFGVIGVKDSSGNRSGFFTRHGYDSIIAHNRRYGTYVTGVSLSIFGINETINRGLFINGLSSYCDETSGVQITGLINNTARMCGISIAGLANISTKTTGLQIALINKCKTGNLVQIGLFNRIGNRVTPFINFRFKKT